MKGCVQRITFSGGLNLSLEGAKRRREEERNRRQESKKIRREEEKNTLEIQRERARKRCERTNDEGVREKRNRAKERQSER